MKRKFYIVLLSFIVVIIPFFFNYNNLEKCSSIKEYISCLEREVPHLLTKYNIPGASISIIDNAQVEWVGTFGYRNVDNQSDMERDTIFQVASISKPVTALGIMKLVEQGKIELDDPIDKYVTRWKIPKSVYDIEQVTVRRLLSHTSGLSNGGGYPGYAPNKPLPSIEESLVGIEGKAKPVKLICEPGTKHIYSGGGYLLLQLLIEEVTGMPFNEFMKTQVLEPAKMTNSSFKWEEFLQSKTAKAYDKSFNQIPNYLYAEEAAAGLYTTIDDLSQLMISEINSHNEKHVDNILGMETMKQVYTSVMEMPGLLGGKVALGHFIEEPKEGIKLISHSGSNRGWKAYFAINPNEKTGISILTNSDNGTYLITEVVNTWYATSFNVDRPIYKLRHILFASALSISSLLFVWSAILLFSLIKEIKNGSRKMTLLKNKYTFILKCFIGIFLLWFTYIIRFNISLINFADPIIENVIFIGLVVRVIVGLLQISFRKIPNSVSTS